MASQNRPHNPGFATATMMSPSFARSGSYGAMFR